MDISWIKKGAKAKIISSANFQELVGTIVTIKEVPQLVHNPKSEKTWVGVFIEEGHDLIEGVHVVPRADRLEPHPKPNYPDWEALAGRTLRNPKKENV